MRIILCACLAVTAAALRPSLASALGPPRGGRAQRASRLVAQEQGLPAGWRSGFDQKSGTTYYVNEQTGESQWEPPPQQGGYAQQGGSAQQSGSAQQGQPQLPYPWEQLADQNGAVYYSNPQTGEASWDPPQ